MRLNLLVNQSVLETDIGRDRSNGLKGAGKFANGGHRSNEMRQWVDLNVFSVSGRQKISVLPEDGFRF
jgi:hypothetical protein